MLKFIGKRLLMMIPVLVGVTLLIFTMLYFTPADAADMILGDSAPQEAVEQLREELGLNNSFFQQYFDYMKGLLTHFDMGISWTTRLSVTDELLHYFPTTIKLAALASLLGAVVGITLGIISAIKQYSAFDKIATALSLIGVSMPNFWLGMMMIILFSVKLGLLPPSGINSPLGWIMPTIALSCQGTAQLARMTRSSMLEVIRQDYIRMARAKGQREFVIVFKHALKNAMIPVITSVGLIFGRLLGGAVLAETVFSVPGLGKLMVDAIKIRNYPIVQGGVLLIAFSMLVVNLLVDVLYALVDPRIRSQYVTGKRRIKAGKEGTKNDAA